MNFVGKFDAKLHVDGSGAHPDAHRHVDSISPHAPSDAIIVPDADLLFHGDFKQSGVDLILSRNDHEWVVEDYFKGEKRVALASPDGAHLTGDIVNALAGHVQYAQADGNAGAGKVIGHVTKLVGTATAIRNGVSIILNQGDNVEKGDVVQSGSGSTLGVTFIDGTVFGLSSNARMVLNEMIYDPNGSDNSTLISLVAGTISFVAGQTAKHGDMKIDTPVATMGIRGTAVLVEIDFDVPGQNGKPEARFQVVMEPDGTIGSYILYDKNTFAPMAIVDKAGQQVHISENNLSFSDSPLTPELQKLISDVFTLKFSTNPQTFTHLTDTLIPQTFPLAPLPNGAVPTATILLVTPSTVMNVASAATPAGGPPIPHINQPPVVITHDSSLTERAGVTGSTGIDSTSGPISFADINLGDRPTAKATISSFTYQNAQHQDIAASAQELADIQALEKIPLSVVQAPGNTYFGTATWTLNVPDKAFDFLGAGDTLTLTYTAEVDSNYSGGSIPGFANFTITITGTNDAPVITTGPEKVAFVNVGTGTTGPNLPPTGPTINKFTFKDPDLTDTHTVSTHLAAATLTGNGIATLDMQALEAKFPRPMDVFESALSAAVTTDSTGTGAGTITWKLADIAAYYADIVPNGEKLTLTYTVTVTDSQGATSSQKVIVTITGSAPPAVVWVETTKDALTDPAPGDWNSGHNWETGTVPTASDDVIIITNQLQGQTPFYPVTIKAGGAAAVAHSVTMNDFETLFTNPPTLINQNTLTVGAGGISLSADAIINNYGTIITSGLLEVLQESSLHNYSQVTLLDGGDFEILDPFKDSNGTNHYGSVTNSGTIEVVGGTLNVEVAVANAGGKIKVDSGATLKLNGAAIDGGTITDNGKIDVTGASTIAGTSTTDANLNGNGAGSTVQLDAALTLDYVKLNGITIENGPLTIKDTVEVAGAVTLLNDTVTNTGATLQVDDGITLKLDGTTINGGTINDFSGLVGGKIDVTGASTIAGTSTTDANLNGNRAGTVTLDAALTLDYVKLNGITIENGPLTIKDTVEVAGAVTLLNDTVTNTGATLQVDDGITLKLDGTTINGGTINDFSGLLGGKIDITGASTIAGTSTTDANLNGNGAGTVTLDAALTLDYVKLNGITIENGPLTIKDTVEVAGAVTLLNDTVTNTGATLQVDDGITLKLNGTTINGGTINDFSSTAGGKIDVTGDSKIDSGAALNNGAVTVEFGVTLTLDGMTVNATTITDKGTIVLGDTVQLKGGATIEGASASALGAITNNGTLEVSGAAELLNDTLTNTSGIIQVDDSQTLTLNGTEIIGGIINDFSGLLGGKIDVTGNSKIDSGATLNKGFVTVESGVTLTLDGMTVNATTITDKGTIVLGDTVKLTGGATIEGASASALGLITNNGTLEVAGAAELLNDTVTNTGATLQVDDSQTLTLNGTEIIGGIINDFSGLLGGKIDVTGDSKIDSGATLNEGAVTVESGVTLTLDGMTVNGTVFYDLVTGGTIQIDSGDTLTFNGATIHGGTLNIVGELDSTGTSFITGATIINSSHIDVVSGTLTIDPAPVTNTGTIEVKGDGTLVLSDEIITNTDGTTKGVIQVDADPTHTATLDLEGSTINGGTVTIAGVLDSTGDSFITGATITNKGTIDVTGGTLTIDATSTLDNTGGTLETNGGNLIINAAIVGSLDIKGGGVLELGSSSANAYSQATVTFEPGATGTLKLDHSETFNGTVAGLDDNTIDLADIVYGSNPTVSYAGNASGGILSVFAGGVDVSNIKLTGDYLGVHWTLTDDGSSHHGTDVMEVPGAVAGLDPNGNATQGVALTASITDGGQTVSGATYEWQVSHDGGKTWVDANGTNGLSSYTPVEADEGQLLRVALSFVDHSGEPEKSFVSAGAVQESLTDDLVATLDSQTAKQGVTMHVLGVTDGGITVTTGLTYAWQDSSDNGLAWVTVGAQPSYTPGESDEGKLMQLVVTYADASGSESSTYRLGMPNDLSATLDSTTAQQGLAIHVTGVKDGGGNVSSGVSYAWQVSSDDGQHWTTVGTHSSFTPIAADAGETLQVIVTYADSEENESATYSLGTVAPAKEWLGGNHDWQTAGQWATSGVPTSSDNAVVDASGFYTLRIDQAAAARSLVVNDLGAVVEILAGNTFTLGGSATIEAGILQVDSGATLKEITSATVTGALIDNGTVEAAGGTLEVASAISFGAGKFKIDAGAVLQLDHADTLKVAFSGSGELILKDPTHFTGIISDGGGSLTSNDVVDVAGFDAGASVSYVGLKSGGIVNISETGHTAVNLLVGANSTHWSAPVSDGHGGILIHDPPADISGQALASVVIPDPAPAATSSTIVVSGPNQILTGNAASDTFAFNFTGVGQTTVTDFHPATDTLQFSDHLFANLQAALNATHDDGHGNTVIALDGHDTITLSGILKAQLHASDFHFV